MYCGLCGELRSFNSVRFTVCRCGNMAARYKSKAHIHVQVIALRKDKARILETNELLERHWATLLKVGEVNDINWDPIRQKQIDDGGKLVTEFVNRRDRERKVQRHHERFKSHRFNLGVTGRSVAGSY